MEFVIGLSVFIAMLVILGILADWIDGDERRDARTRNPRR